MNPVRFLLALPLLLAALPASAHTGLHLGSGFASGLAHPFLGLDHLLAMVMVGMWAAQQGSAWQRLLPPLVFVSAMAVGGFLGEAGIALPQVETGIAVSVLGLGLLTAFAVRLPWGAGVPLIALFALFHGHAHGAEMPAVALWSYLPGFILATASLHALGYAGASALPQGRWTRTAGFFAAVAGGNLLLG